MTRAEFTDETFNLPRLGAPHMDNLIGTMLRAGNRLSRMTDSGLDRIAFHQRFDAADFRARYAHLDHAWEAELSRASQQPSNIYEQPEGK